MANGEPARVPNESSLEASARIVEQLAWARQVLADEAEERSDSYRRAVHIVFDLVDRLEAMLQHTTDMITVLSADGRIRYSNAAAGALTGFGEDVNGMEALEFIHPDDRDRAIEALVSCAAEPGAVAEAEVRLRFADGQWHDVEAYARNCLDSSVDGIVVSMRDITERNHAARVRAAAHDAMRDFVALASHELRTPTTVIKGFTDTLQRRWDEIPESERRVYTSAVAGAADRLSRLIDDLLILSTSDASEHAPRRPIEVSTTVAAVVERFRSPPGQLEIDVPPGTQVMANGAQLERMLGNLLDNALRYGSPPIRVEATPQPASVLIAVEDRGPGVPRPFEPELFGRFARADKSASRLTGGTGLGLAVVRALARANGGDAWYEPNVAAGARFVVELGAP